MLGVTDDLFARSGEILVLKQKLTSTLCWIQNGDSWRACHSINYWTTFFPWSKKSITEQFLPKKHSIFRARKIRFSGACAPQNKFRRTLHTSKFCAPCNFLRYTCSPQCIPRRAPNEISCRKVKQYNKILQFPHVRVERLSNKKKSRLCFTQ